MMKKRWLKKTGIVLFWLLVWQLGADTLNQPIILTGPVQVAQALLRLIPQGEFWRTIGVTLAKISIGFMAALTVGFMLGILSCRCHWLKELLAPAVSLLRSIPVASFVILALIWTGSENLSVLISFLVVLPVIYGHTLTGMESTDKKLLEMASVFRVSLLPRWRRIYWPSLKPYLQEGIRIAIGFCWKSGVAAEVIGVPDHSIGEKLYMAKIYLCTDELLAWTLMVIVLSAAFEKLWLLVIGGKKGVRRQ